jgi:penicillin-binding protein 1A
MLSSEKTFTRKLKDILLAIEMEKNLSKEDILYLYLNQIYFGQSAYGIELAAQTYYRKSVKDLSLSEMAILAGLPQAPSRYSPIKSPKKAKERQHYVLRRMVDVKYITQEEADKALQEPVTVFVREKFEEIAPFYLETIRQLLVEKLGEETLLDKGLSIYTGLDIESQKAAQASVRQGLRDLDKRQGYRGVLKNLADQEEILNFLSVEKERIISESTDQRIILPNGEFAPLIMGEAVVQKTLPSFLKQK